MNIYAIVPYFGKQLGKIISFFFFCIFSVDLLSKPKYLFLKSLSRHQNQNHYLAVYFNFPQPNQKESS